MDCILFIIYASLVCSTTFATHDEM